MLREEQIDIRRQRALEGKFQIEGPAEDEVFGEYQVTNPTTGGQYQVTIRGFDVGDNACTCPDFRTNTLGTCKHIEAVLVLLREETPPALWQRKATVIRPEIVLHYGEQLQLGLHLPEQHSDVLAVMAETFFDAEGLWKGGDDYGMLIEAAEHAPEEVTIFSDAMEFMERELDRHAMAQREQEVLQELERGRTPAVLEDLLAVPLYPYQMRGAIFAAYRGRVILGDDMGLGKTIESLAAVEIMARERGVERVLVVAPASVKYQWESEIRKCTERGVQVIDGNSDTRHDLYAEPTFYRLVNYELVLKDLAELNDWQPDVIILDEAQRIKNWEAKISRAVKKLRSPYAIVLTGTPLENKLEELYSIVQFVDDRRLGPAFQFLHDHRVLDEDGKLQGYRNLDRIREKLQPILLRRTRKEVLTQLPGRTDQTVYVEMTSQQRSPYTDQQSTLARLLQKKYLGEVDRRRILCCIANLRMLCDSTFLYDKSTNVSPKLDEFSELMQELVVEGTHKVVVFSQWEAMLRKAAETLDSMWVSYVLFHGNVPGPQRRELMERFRDEPACRVFLSTDTGGTGLNLQSADTVINLEPPWNPAVLEQRIARVHRLGQHRPVQVLNLVTRDSIEERVLKTIAVKRALFEGVFEGTTDEVSFGALGQQGFLQLVRDLVAPEAPPAPRVPLPAPLLGGGVTAALRESLPALSHPASPAGASGRVAQAGLQLLEALAELAVESPGVMADLPAETRQRTRRALQALLQKLG
jgi:SNF2 family DNA or RNA helicase